MSINMHSTTLASSTTKPTATTTTNIEHYHYPPISTLRRASRPSNIDLSIFDHHNAQQSNDPGIYSAPIFYIKQTNNHQQHIPQTSHPYSTTLQYQSQQLQPLQLPQHYHSQHQPHATMHLYQQQSNIIDPFNEHQHTPHTFPLQASPNHHHQYFYFPPPNVQINLANNNRQTTNSSQPSTPSHTKNSLHQMQNSEPQKQQWSNPVLSSLMVERMNENATSMPIDDDEDPSASIDALVADVDSNSQDLLDDEQNKNLNQPKNPSTIPSNTILPSSHVYLRSKSHILTTPPNPLASDDHPDNQLTVGNNFQKTFSPIPSAGFELTNTTNNGIKTLASAKTASRFTFDSNLLENTDDNDDTNPNLLAKPLDIRTTRISSNSLIQDDNSNHSSTNSSCHHPTSRIFSQMIKSSEQPRISSSSSPLSNDIKLSTLDPDNNQTNMNSLSSQQQNRHFCAHPDCNKTFANKSALAKHKLTHSQDRKHICPKCNKGFKRLDHLNGHMLTHEEEKPHKCRIPSCNRTYCDARSLKRHIENTHQDILAAIHEGSHEEYRSYLPEAAFVKTKDLSLHNELSIDSIDSNSPHSLIDHEQSFNIRASTGSKATTIYTFDEEKSIECPTCKKTFKNGAALNGHMRLHGGYVATQATASSSPSTDTKPKKKRTANTNTTAKRKRKTSPSRSISIKKEDDDTHRMPSNNIRYQQSSPCSKINQNQFYDKTFCPSPSNIIPITTSSLSSYNITNVMQQSSKPPPIPTYVTSSSSKILPNIIVPQNPLANRHLYTYPTPLQPYEEKIREVMVNDQFLKHAQLNGGQSPHTYVRLSPYQPSSNLSQFEILPSPSILNGSKQSPIVERFIIQNNERYNQDFPLQHSISSVDDPIHYTSSPRFNHSPVPTSTSLFINTPVTSPYSNQNTSHSSPISPQQKCNENINGSTVISNSMQPSPVTYSTTSSSSSSLSSLNGATQNQSQRATNEQIHYEDNKQEPNINDDGSIAVLEIVPDADTPTRQTSSGFLIGTPSSTGNSLSASSSTSSNTHFHYDDIPPPKKPEPTPSSFQWPSQFRRQLSLHLAHPKLNPIPSTPYTPPPMLSPFRKGPGLYYRVFSHPGTSNEPSSIPTTPIVPVTPAGDESTGPKINVGREYQAMIPKLQTKCYDDDTGKDDELLFSPSELKYLDEKSLEKFEKLNRMNPYLFSPRDSPVSYPLELVYMLLHEYNGDLRRTLTALLEGTANDIRQCRPIHNYHFLDCDKWTKEEIAAFTKAMLTDKNFELISQAVGTKTIKQCIEFYYMPKTGKAARKVVSTRTSAVITRRKRFQMIKEKQRLDDELSSSSSFNECRTDEDGSTMHSDCSSVAQYSCDIDECSQTFATDRACRAHRKSHRRTKMKSKY